MAEDLFPRPPWRGLVEARQTRMPHRDQFEFPRPPWRGPVEATRTPAMARNRSDSPATTTPRFARTKSSLSADSHSRCSKAITNGRRQESPHCTASWSQCHLTLLDPLQWKLHQRFPRSVASSTACGKRCWRSPTSRGEEFGETVRQQVGWL